MLGLPEPGAMIDLSPAYQPAIIKGLTVHKNDPFLFDFIVDVGQDHLQGRALKTEGEKLIKYFLASLAIPEKDLWVNLPPYEKTRVIPNALGQTEMGRDLLAQDYILKQITASLIYPEKNLGKIFWDKVYSAARSQFATTQIPVNTFNKVWIVADKAEIFERNQTVFVTNCHLKVMLEEDYLATIKGTSPFILTSNDSKKRETSPLLMQNILRQIILPQLEHEVNYGQNFANLRQICNSIILSSWYKRNLKQALLNQVYSNKEKVRGIDLQDKTIKEQIYQRYLEAYKKGVFNYIKEETLPRKYFSGGFIEGALDAPSRTTDVQQVDLAMKGSGPLEKITAGMKTKHGIQDGLGSMTQERRNDIRQWILDLMKLKIKFEQKIERLAEHLGIDPLNSAFRRALRDLSSHLNNVRLREIALYKIIQMIPAPVGSDDAMNGTASGRNAIKTLAGTRTPADSAMNETASAADNRKARVVRVEYGLDFGRLQDELEHIADQVSFEPTVFLEIMQNSLYWTNFGAYDKEQMMRFFNTHLHLNYIYDLFVYRSSEHKIRVQVLSEPIRQEIVKGKVILVSKPKKGQVPYRKLNAASEKIAENVLERDPWIEQDPNFDRETLLDNIREQLSDPAMPSKTTKELIKGLPAIGGALWRGIPSLPSVVLGYNRHKDLRQVAYLDAVSAKENLGASDAKIRRLSGFNNFAFVLLREPMSLQALREYSGVFDLHAEKIYKKNEADRMDDGRWIQIYENKTVPAGKIVYISSRDKIAMSNFLIPLTAHASRAMTVQDLAAMLRPYVQAVADDANAEFNDPAVRKMENAYLNDYHHGPRHAADLLEKAYRLAQIIRTKREDGERIYNSIEWDVLLAAIVLHDVYSYGKINHGPEAMTYAETFLLQFGFTPEKIRKVQEAIRWHDEYGPEGIREREKAGIESEILFNVDQLEAFGYKGIYRFTAVYAGRGGSITSIARLVPVNSSRRYDSLSPEAKEIADEEENYPVLKEFFQKLQAGDAGAIWAAQYIHEHRDEHPVWIASAALEVLHRQTDLPLNPEQKAYAQLIFSNLYKVYEQETDITKALGDLIVPADLGVNEVALTGSTGFLGTVLSRALSRRGAKTRALVLNDSEGAKLNGTFPHFENVVGTLLDVPRIKALVKGKKVFINLAADTRTGVPMVNYEEAGSILSTNVLGAAVSLLASRDEDNEGMKKIFISSFDYTLLPVQARVWADDQAKAISDYAVSYYNKTAVKIPQNYFAQLARDAEGLGVKPYPLSKYLMDKVIENLSERFGIRNVIVLRFMGPIGVDMGLSQAYGVVMRLADAILTKEDLPPNQKARPYTKGVSTSLIYADDVIKVLIELSKIKLTQTQAQRPLFLQLGGPRMYLTDFTDENQQSHTGVTTLVKRAFLRLGVSARDAGKNIQPTEPPPHYEFVKAVADLGPLEKVLGHAVNITPLPVAIERMAQAALLKKINSLVDEIYPKFASFVQPDSQGILPLESQQNRFRYFLRWFILGEMDEWDFTSHITEMFPADQRDAILADALAARQKSPTYDEAMSGTVSGRDVIRRIMGERDSGPRNPPVLTELIKRLRSLLENDLQVPLESPIYVDIERLEHYYMQNGSTANRTLTQALFNEYRDIFAQLRESNTAIRLGYIIINVMMNLAEASDIVNPHRQPAYRIPPSEIEFELDLDIEAPFLAIKHKKSDLEAVYPMDDVFARLISTSVQNDRANEIFYHQVARILSILALVIRLSPLRERSELDGELYILAWNAAKAEGMVGGDQAMRVIPLKNDVMNRLGGRHHFRGVLMTLSSNLDKADEQSDAVIEIGTFVAEQAFYQPAVTIIQHLRSMANGRYVITGEKNIGLYKVFAGQGKKVLKVVLQGLKDALGNDDLALRGKNPLADKIRAAQQRGYLDKAMGSKGGIDLNTQNTSWKDRKEGAGVQMHMDQAMLNRIKEEGIDSLSPEIYSITPITDLWSLIK